MLLEQPQGHVRAQSLARPEAKEKALAAGFEARPAGPEQLRARILADAPKFKVLIERAGIVLQ